METANWLGHITDNQSDDSFHTSTLISYGENNTELAKKFLHSQFYPSMAHCEQKGAATIECLWKHVSDQVSMEYFRTFSCVYMQNIKWQKYKVVKKQKNKTKHKKGRKLKSHIE